MRVLFDMQICLNLGGTGKGFGEVLRKITNTLRLRRYEIKVKSQAKEDRQMLMRADPKSQEIEWMTDGE